MRRQLTMEQVASRLERQTVRRNKRFDKATPAGKRVMVAKDVLEQLRVRRYTARHGIYFQVRVEKLDSYARALDTEAALTVSDHWDGAGSEAAAKHSAKIARRLMRVDLSAAINTLGCNVCAVGAAFASCVRLDDKLKIGQAVDGDSEVFTSIIWGGSMARKVQRFFPKSLLHDMEHAFEDGGAGYHNVEKGAKRLRAIFRNLIDNKGKRFTHYKGAYTVWPEPKREPIKFTRTPSPRPFPEPWLAPPMTYPMPPLSAPVVLNRRGPDLAESLAGDEPGDL